MLHKKSPLQEKKINAIPFIAGLTLLIAGAGLFFILSNPSGPASDASDSIQNCRDIDRSTYAIIPEVFDSLPSPPKCFHSAVEAFYEQRLTDDYFFSRDYYLQPEFYPDFSAGGKNQWINPNYAHWGVVGYGAFPLQRELVMHAGETKKVRLFVHAGFGVRAFQGMGVRVSYKYADTPKALGVTLNETAVQGFVLGPTFPKIHPAWAYPIDIELHVKEDAPAQNLEMTFYSTQPQNPEALAAPIVGRYSNATDYLGERPLAALIVQIR